MILLCKLLFDILANVLASVVARWVMRALHIENRREQYLARLANKRARRKSSLTKKEVLAYGVIKYVDSRVVSEATKNMIVDLLAERGLVWKGEKKDPHFLTPLSIDVEQVFLNLNQILVMTVLNALNSLYDKENITCIAVLPFPRQSKSRVTAGFERALVECLRSLAIPIDFLTPAVLRERPLGQAVTRTKEMEKILVVQPVGVNDDYLVKSVSYIRNHSMSQILEILTIIDPSGRSQSLKSTDPPERVLIELDLTHQ